MRLRDPDALLSRSSHIGDNLFYFFGLHKPLPFIVNREFSYTEITFYNFMESFRLFFRI